jgi:drug/metabolite transporter (DMT)-like permease
LDTRKPLDAQAVGLMLVLCLVWSMQQIALKATATDFSPLLQIAVRSGLSAMLVWAFMHWQGERLSLAGGLWQPGLVVGGLFALEFLLIGLAVRHTSASHIGVFLYTSPLFAALGLHGRLPSERLAPVQWVGIGLAFVGTTWAFLSRSPAVAAEPTDTAFTHMLWGDFLALLAGAAWGATTVAVRTTRLSSLPAAHTLLYQLLTAFVLLLPAAFVMGHTTFVPSALVWATLVFQAIVVSFISYLAWFWLLRRYVAAPLGVFSFMTPLFGVVLGAWLLHEPLETGFVTGALVVLAGVMLVTGGGWWKARSAG